MSSNAHIGFFEKEASQPVPSDWCGSRGKQLFDFTMAILGIACTFPMMVLVATAVKVSSRGPMLFRQYRVGKDGKRFELLKFRTMIHDPADSSPGVTRSGDPRVTAAGGFLRRWKLDELPQLLNVLGGDMSFIGPRPDQPQFIAALAPDLRQILRLRPGITGAATIRFRDEQQLLAGIEGEELITHYVKIVLPLKAQLDLEYARTATFLTDLHLLFRTLCAIFR